MTVTNDYKHEVAAKLRNGSVVFYTRKQCSETHLQNCSWCSDFECCDNTTLCSLADLIEPEPEPERTCQIDTSRYENGGAVSCGACCKRIPTKSRSTKTVEAKYPYCPWCGAKVIDSEG